MVRLVGMFSRIVRSKIMVIGDIGLDTYTVGKAQRISPEAPVAVLKVQREECRAGMAGNVALNLVSLGAEVLLVGRVGEDAAGGLLKRLLEEEEINTKGLWTQPGFQTPVKNRIIAENQQIVRVDREEALPLSTSLEEEMIRALPHLLQETKVVALSDYSKGFFSPTFLQAIIQMARAEGIPVIADPKGRDFKRYAGVAVIKPNLSEAIAAADLGPHASLEAVASRVLELSDAQTLMVTRSEKGISLFCRAGSREDFPVKPREVKDVTGAGDTVLAMLACALGSGLSLSEACQLCNAAAGLAIEQFGCARISLSQLAVRLLQDNQENKVCDEEHLFALQEALRERKLIVLGMDSSKGLSSYLFSWMRRFSGQGNALLIYLRDASPEESFIELLISLREVDFIIQKSDSLKHLCSVLQPAEVYVAEGEEVKLLKHSLELLSVS